MAKKKKAKRAKRVSKSPPSKSGLVVSIAEAQAMVDRINAISEARHGGSVVELQFHRRETEHMRIVMVENVLWASKDSPTITMSRLMHELIRASEVLDDVYEAIEGAG